MAVLMPVEDSSRPSADRLDSLLEFETLISDLSSRFINLPPGEVDCEIEDALRRVCGRFLSAGSDARARWPRAGTPGD